MTHSGVVLGTPDYMAPEQVRGMPVTPQTDIWAAGAVLYELLTFEKPFSGETLHAVLFKVVTEEPPAITKLNPSLPEALERIVNTALNKEAGRRYSAADAMAADLSSVRKHLSELETKATLRFSRPLIAMELPLMERLSRSPLGKGLGRAGALLATTAQVVLKPAKAWLNRVPVPAPLRSGSAALAAVGVAVIGVGAMVLVALAKGVPVEAAEVTARALVVSDTAPSRVPAPQIAAVAPTSPPVAAQRTPRRTSEAATAPRRPATPTGTAPITDPKTQPVAAVPAATASDPKRAVREAVERLERAMASADVSRIKALYPGLTSSSAKGWEDFFRPKKNLTADFRPGDIKVKDESAEATFQMRFAFVDAAGAKKTIDWTGEGKLEKTPTGWVWKSLGLKR
jgi:serine/threonine-protein kinase